MVVVCLHRVLLRYVSVTRARSSLRCVYTVVGRGGKRRKEEKRREKKKQREREKKRERRDERWKEGSERTEERKRKRESRAAVGRLFNIQGWSVAAGCCVSPLSLLYARTSSAQWQFLWFYSPLGTAFFPPVSVSRITMPSSTLSLSPSVRSLLPTPLFCSSPFSAGSSLSFFPLFLFFLFLFFLFSLPPSRSQPSRTPRSLVF